MRRRAADRYHPRTCPLRLLAHSLIHQDPQHLLTRQPQHRGWEESERAARQQVLAMEKTRRREFERVKERLKEEAKNAD